MFYKKKHNTKKSRGFTVIEAIFGIFLIGIIGTSFFAIMSKVLKTQFTLRDKIIATNLAQEGIEIVRNQRDNNLKSGNEAFSTLPFTADTTCTGTNLTPCNQNPPSISTTPVNLRAKFTITINVTGCGDDCKQVKSEVKSGTIILASIVDTLYAWGNP